jgi:4-diphosphocytidyl-2-C-methyl-D-erythritol kinase
VVFGQHPQIGKIKRKLARLGARPALMSGSGSAVYGIFDTRAEAAIARRSLPGETFAVTLVSRARYRAMWWRRLGAHITGRVWPPRSRYG